MKDFQSPDQYQLKFTACDCGNINVSYKSVTLHFSREEFYQYATAITQFLCKIRMAPSLSAPLPETQALASYPFLEKEHDIFD